MPSPAPSSAKHRVATLAFWSIVVAFGVMGLKFVAWKMTGSVALYSDALESIVNVIASAGAFWAIRVSHTPADRDHPFGHHKEGDEDRPESEIRDFLLGGGSH